LDPLHKMPDLRIVGQPERAVRASDDATQVAYVKRAAPVVEVGVRREGVERHEPHARMQGLVSSLGRNSERRPFRFGFTDRHIRAA